MLQKRTFCRFFVDFGRFLGSLGRSFGSLRPHLVSSGALLGKLLGVLEPILEVPGPCWTAFLSPWVLFGTILAGLA